MSVWSGRRALSDGGRPLTAALDIRSQGIICKEARLQDFAGEARCREWGEEEEGERRDDGGNETRRRESRRYSYFRPANVPHRLELQDADRLPKV